LTVRRWWRRFRDEPPGIWLGRPHIGARWHCDGETYVLVSVTTDLGAGVRLEYLPEHQYRAQYMMPGG
jgi:Ni/Co efflux regulator RcnB